MHQSSEGLLIGTVGGNIYRNSSSGLELLNKSMDAVFIWSLYEIGGIIYAGTEKGLFIYDGSDWKNTTLIDDVRSITSLDNKIFAAVWGKGVFCSEGVDIRLAGTLISGDSLIDPRLNWSSFNSIIGR